MLRDQEADRLVGGIVKSVVAVEEADDGVGIENYRHSSRSPSTCSRRSPLVCRQPE